MPTHHSPFAQFAAARGLLALKLADRGTKAVADALDSGIGVADTFWATAKPGVKEIDDIGPLLADGGDAVIAGLKLVPNALNIVSGVSGAIRHTVGPGHGTPEAKAARNEALKRVATNTSAAMKNGGGALAFAVVHPVGMHVAGAVTSALVPGAAPMVGAALAGLAAVTPVMPAVLLGAGLVAAGCSLWAKHLQKQIDRGAAAGGSPGSPAANPNAHSPAHSPTSHQPQGARPMSINASPEAMRTLAGALRRFEEDVQAAKDHLTEAVRTASDDWEDANYTRATGEIDEMLNDINVEQAATTAEDITRRADALDEALR